MSASPSSLHQPQESVQEYGSNGDEDVLRGGAKIMDWVDILSESGFYHQVQNQFETYWMGSGGVFPKRIEKCGISVGVESIQ